MRLRNAIDDKLFDIRLRDKFLADSKISKPELDKYIDSLSDDSENCEYLDAKGNRKNLLDKNE